MAENLVVNKSSTFFNVVVSGITILIIAIALLYTAHHKADRALFQEIHQQEKNLRFQTERKLEQLDIWLDELAHQGQLFVNDYVIREYTTRIEIAGGNLSELLKPLKLQDRVTLNQQTMELAIQIPLMQNTLKEFARYAGFLNGRILNGSGVPVIATNMMLPPLTIYQNKLIKKVASEGKVHFSSFRNINDRLVLDICLPIYAPESENSTPPVGFLILTKDATSTIQNILSLTPLSEIGEQTILIQENGDKYHYISKNNDLNLKRFDIKLSFNISDQQLLFTPRNSITAPSTNVYSYGQKVVNNNWWIIQEIEISSVSEHIKQNVRAIYAVAWLGIASIILVTILIWWILLGVQRKKIAKNFRILAHQIDEQQQFIHSINTSINDFITLKDLTGKYIYSNKSFNVAVGKTPEEIVGLNCTDLFGAQTATKLEASDHLVIKNKQKVTITEPIVFHNNEFYFQISKAPYIDKERTTIGIVEVYRDITDFLEIQKKNELHNIKTIEALNKAITAVDPHLSGHTRILCFLAEHISDVLKLTATEKKYLITAANLSQIGKAFIPREILTKPEQLSVKEIEIVQNHVQHALQLLRETDVDEKVLTIIHQMHEKLNGSGYPQQLTADNIEYSAKVLGPLNIFCALIQPRSYRKPVNIDKAILLLHNQRDCFDTDIINALKSVLDNSELRNLLAQFISHNK